MQSIASIVDAAAPDGDSEVTVTFVNHLSSKQTVSLMWVNHAGEEQASQTQNILKVNTDHLSNAPPS